MEIVYLGIILVGIQVLRLWWLWIVLAAFSLLWKVWPAMIFFMRVFDVVSWLWLLWCGLAFIGLTAYGMQKLLDKREKKDGGKEKGRSPA